jgi:TPR repeat protein
MLAVFSAVPLVGQERLPFSTEALHATLAKLRELTQSELSEVSLKAESGNREAQYWLALIYEEGQLVPKDYAASRDLMLKSAQQGYAPAQAGMGRFYLNKSKGSTTVRDYGDADRWLRLAAMQGDAEAQFWLGAGYEQGWFGVTDCREALRWLGKAAQQGLPDAQFCLGQMYEDGEGVPESAVVAARWYRKAADHSPSWLGGVWEAEGRLADMYRDDRLPRDDVQAYMWFAVVSSTLDPPTHVGIKKISRRMTKAQIMEAQRQAEDWIKRHPLKTQNLAQAER